MFLLKTKEYNIEQNKLGFIYLKDNDNNKLKCLGHKLFFKKVVFCDDYNFIIAFSKIHYDIVHYDMNEKNYFAKSFKCLKFRPYVSISCISDSIIKFVSLDTTILYNWQSKEYYKDENITTTVDNQDLIVSKKLKYDDEEEGLYLEDMLHYNLDSNNFKVKDAYSELQKRKIDFKDENKQIVLF